MATQTEELMEIPGPAGLPIVGNLWNIDLDSPLSSLIRICREYGPICQITVGGNKKLLVGSHAILDELCDEKRFHKAVTGGVGKLRHLTEDGLFTAYHDQHTWGIAHRILMPVFGPMKIREMFPEMKDVAVQLCLKWARYGPEHAIAVTDDFTRLTLDTIALCSMDLRFNSFYKDQMHPFVDSMNEVLKEAGVQAQIPDLLNHTLRRGSVSSFHASIATMRATAAGLIARRRAHPVATPDLLNTLLHGRDPVTGEGLADSAIIDQLITFLVAGHETTSGLLSFAFYYLAAHPRCLAAARAEVDAVVGAGPIAVEHLARLPYLTAVLRETLRLQPTAPGFELSPFADTVVGGKYKISKDDVLLAILPAAHRDPAVWGPDADAFVPERMLDEAFERLPRNAWKPFGTGARACIGRAFAWQEALLVAALVLQCFDVEMVDPAYELRVKDSLTIKPDGFEVRVRLRRHASATELLEALGGGVAAVGSEGEDGESGDEVGGGRPMTVLYGSNSGSCETLAHRLARDAAKMGWAAAPIATLDSAVEKLPTGQPVVVITASYDGEPADNAAEFVKWLEGLEGEPLKDVEYAVFGCGHRDWQATFHRIPKLIDDLLEKAGAKRVATIGTADSAVSDLLSDLDAWQEETLWPALGHETGAGDEADMIKSMLKVEISQPRRNKIYNNLVEGTVTETCLLTAPGAPVKKHVEILLPPGTTYAPGDHLQVLPVNPRRDVQRALARFHLTWDSLVKIGGKKNGVLPAKESIPAGELLGHYVELSQPATPKDLRILAAAATNPATKDALIHLAATFSSTTSATRAPSILNLLTSTNATIPSATTIPLPFGTFLSLLPPLRLRTYSISSSPTHHANHASLTFSVVASHQPADDPASAPPHLGVASNHLADLSRGDIVALALRPTKPCFHLPADPTTPTIMVAAGTGIAPFRGFVQERAAHAGETLLFFGCRAPGVDDLYRDELDRLEAAGAVQVRRAYSRVEEGRALGPAEARGHVQELVAASRAELVGLWERGARVYVCGSPRMANAVKGVFAEVAWEVARGAGEVRGDGVGVGEWFGRFENGRYAAEIFA
ncbi:hypothetical protein M431DRAFT_81893 [Neofusicoccum parvum]|nr:hypothetical protein M431DRAFT_81893 [Neofusicoccum parvum]